MKPLLRFLRTTLVGGILFLVPIIVLFLFLDRGMVLALKVVEPLSEHLPVHSVIGLRTPVLLAAGVLVLFCFLAGFFARTGLAKKLVAWLESSVLSSVPGYQILKSVGESALGVEHEGVYPVVLVRMDDNWQLAFRVDVLEGGLVAVFVPNAPDPRTGSVYFVTPDRVTPTGISPGRAVKLIKRLGAGSKALIRGVPGGAPP
jgi:uncharacterized membrane protein